MRGLVFLGAALAAISAAHAQDYPNKPVRAITTLTAGGTSDVFARVLGEQFQKRTGQPIVVENRPGGAMNIGGQACAAAPPDGYTFCLLTIETLAYNQYLFKAPGYDPVKQFEPVTNAFYITAALVVSSELKVKSLDQLAAYGKAHPGALNYMSPAVPLVYFMEQWRKNTGADIVRVPYKGGADAANALLNGSTPVALMGIANIIPHIRAGTITAIAVDSEARSPLMPDVPTLREIGYAGPLTPAYVGIVVPAGTPKPVITKLRDIIADIASDKGFAERNMINLGLVPIMDTPDQFAHFLASNRELAARIVKESGLEPQ
ncbi:MAG: Bug family tripartite tricarboxylate transporter substrate binding protein [Rhizomicrobium sp.]